MKQDATWKQKGTHNGYGWTWTSTPIKCRFVQKRRMVRNSSGANVISEASLNCIEAIQEDDIITYNGKDWPVIAVSETPDGEGVVWFREVAL
jgi:hypothetical protein